MLPYRLLALCASLQLILAWPAASTHAGKRSAPGQVSQAQADALVRQYQKMGLGAIAGAIIGFLVLCVLMGWAGFACKGRAVQRKKEKQQRQEAARQRDMEAQQRQAEDQEYDDGEEYADQHPSQPYGNQMQGVNDPMQQMLNQMLGIPQPTKNDEEDVQPVRRGSPPKVREPGGLAALMGI